MYYLVTLAKHRVKEYVDYYYLESIIKSLDKQCFNIIDYCLERHGTYKQLHAHFIVQVNKHFRYKSHVNMVSGFIMQFEPILTPLNRPRQYIHKHCQGHSEEYIIDTHLSNYFNNHYAF